MKRIGFLADVSLSLCTARQVVPKGFLKPNTKTPTDLMIELASRALSPSLTHSASHHLTPHNPEDVPRTAVADLDQHVSLANLASLITSFDLHAKGLVLSIL